MRTNAHEYTDRLRRAKTAGLWGIELHDCKDRASAVQINSLVREFAHSVGLRLIYGSDFHRDTADEYPSLGGAAEGFSDEARAFAFADG